jgi:hypothetical protein
MPRTSDRNAAIEAARMTMSVWQESRQQDAIENLRIVADWVRESAGLVLGLVPGWCWDLVRDWSGTGPGLGRDWSGMLP